MIRKQVIKSISIEDSILWIIKDESFRKEVESDFISVKGIEYFKNYVHIVTKSTSNKPRGRVYFDTSLIGD